MSIISNEGRVLSWYEILAVYSKIDSDTSTDVKDKGSSLESLVYEGFKTSGATIDKGYGVSYDEAIGWSNGGKILEQIEPTTGRYHWPNYQLERIYRTG